MFYSRNGVEFDSWIHSRMSSCRFKLGWNTSLGNFNNDTRNNFKNVKLIAASHTWASSVDSELHRNLPRDRSGLVFRCTCKWVENLCKHSICHVFAFIWLCLESWTDDGVLAMKTWRYDARERNWSLKFNALTWTHKFLLTINDFFTVTSHCLRGL